jgi:hypothetical protein
MKKWTFSFTILNLDTRWIQVASFKPRPLKLRAKNPRHPIERLGEPQSLSELCGVGKNIMPLPGIELRRSSP